MNSLHHILHCTITLNLFLAHYLSIQSFVLTCWHNIGFLNNNYRDTLHDHIYAFHSLSMYIVYKLLKFVNAALTIFVDNID